MSMITCDSYPMVTTMSMVFSSGQSPFEAAHPQAVAINSGVVTSVVDELG
jgi:hypothetical protein